MYSVILLSSEKGMKMKRIKQLFGLAIYKIAPIKHNRYVFTSFSGHYSDNTKYISIKLHEIDKNAEIVWLVRPEYEKDVPGYAKVIKIDTLREYWYRGTATAQIDNVYGFRANFKMVDSKITNVKLKILSFLSNKKKQPIFATMHGTPVKKIGRDQIGNTVLDMYCPNTYLLVGDKLTADVLERVTFEKIPIEVLGSPRNDILFSANENIKINIGLPKDKKILLFAPTFRNDGKDVEGKNVYRSGINQLAEMDFDRLFQTLSHKFGGEWVMVCRFHYHVVDLVDWKSLEKRYPGKFINGNQHDDMADYLACSDILITDSSSCMHDFSLTQKPCFLYFPDLDNYENKERGFYIKLEELPFSVAVDFSTLLNNIANHNQKDYENKINQFLVKIASKNDGNASERVVNYILKKCRKR